MYYEVDYNSVSPLNFSNLFYNIHKEFITEQQDCMDFMRTLLNDLIKENNRISTKPKYEKFDSLKVTKNEIGKDYHEFYLKSEDSFINDLFYLQLSNTYTCACGFEKYNFQKCSHIPIYIPINNRNYNFNYLIKYNFNEIIKDTYDECEFCKKKNITHYKEIKFNMINEIIIFIIQRIDYKNNTKNESFIEYDDVLNLKDIIDDELKEKNLNYQLLYLFFLV